MIPIDLSGTVALVTGASQGLGEATALMLHRAGASVAVNFWDDPAGANRLRAEAVVARMDAQDLSARRAVAIPADVRRPAEVAAMVAAAIARFGRLDIVVNNAGILRDRTLKNMSDDEWQAVIDTNLTGVFNVCKAAAPVLADGGRIVNLASIAASLGFFGQANYAAAKAGVGGLTRVLARELAKRAITVNAVAPGVVLTDMGATIPEAERARMLAQVPLARFGEPDDIAGVILFLCSRLSGYITGQTIHVSGGWYPT
ncbi:MAG: 3-oxoacyl-ACP reductase FabG [Planctomycetes bacterium]|nr:3-oxoacyl-ACP reductase FabG [Planctomycetota bacterium]